MRQRKYLIKNREFYKMCRQEYKSHKAIYPNDDITFLRWVILKWDELVQAYDFLIE